MDEMQRQMIHKLYMEMRPKLIHYSYCALNDSFLAEETVHETFVIACKKPNELLESHNPQGWLTLTLKNVIRNTQRANAILNKYFVTTLAFDDQIMNQAQQNEKPDLYYSDLLEPNEYKLLKLVVIEKYSMSQAAEEFGISIEACTTSKKEAKRGFRN